MKWSYGSLVLHSTTAICQWTQHTTTRHTFYLFIATFNIDILNIPSPASFFFPHLMTLTRKKMLLVVLPRNSSVLKSFPLRKKKRELTSWSFTSDCYKATKHWHWRLKVTQTDPLYADTPWKTRTGRYYRNANVLELARARWRNPAVCRKSKLQSELLL